MTLVQIAVREGEIKRVPRGSTPVIEIELEPGQQIVAFDVDHRDYAFVERKTVDWTWTAWVATRL